MDVEVKLLDTDLDLLGGYILRREQEYRRERIRRTALRAMVVLVCSALALFIFQGQGAPEAAARVTGSFVVLIGIYLAVIYFGGGASAQKRVDRIIGSDEMDAARDRQYYLTQAGVQYKGNGGSGQAGWSDIAEIADTDEHIYVFANGQLPYVLPRRSFRSEQEALQFVRLARDYHGQATGIDR